MSDPPPGDSEPPDPPAPAITRNPGGIGRRWLTALYRPHERPPESLYSRAMAELIVILIVAIFLFVCPPFAMEDSAKQQAARIMQRVLAPWNKQLMGAADRSEGGPPIAPADRWTTAGQKAITVVRLDQDWLDQTGTADGRPVWPAPIDNLETLLKAVIAAKPRVIFVDMAFPVAPREISAGGKADRSTAAAHLGQVLAQLDPPMPVLIGEVVDSDLIDETNCGDIPYLDEKAVALSRITDPLIQNGVAASAGKVGFVDILQSKADEGGYQLAPLRLGPRGNCTLAETSPTWLAAPALAMFEIYVHDCANAAAKDMPCADQRVHELANSIKLQRAPDRLIRVGPDAKNGLAARATGTLGVLWGLRLSKFMQSSLEQSEGADRCASQIQQSMFASVKVFLQNAFNRSDSDLDTNRCLYIDNISGADVLAKRVWKLGQPDQFDANSILADRAVLIGATVSQARDTITSPVNGDVAGVYLHAAALENLLSAGSQIHSETASGAWLAQGAALLFVVLIRLIVFQITKEPWAPCSGRWRSIRQLGCFALQYLAIPIILFLITLVGGGLVLFYTTSLTLTALAGPLLLMALSVVEITQEMVREAIAYSLIQPDSENSAVNCASRPYPILILSAELEE